MLSASLLKQCSRRGGVCLSSVSSKLNTNITHLPTNITKRHHSFIRDTTRNRDLVLYGIMGTNLAVFLLWQQAKNDRQLNTFMNKHFTLSKFGVTQKHRYHTLFTATFSHADFTHLLFNMLAFYTFGKQTVHMLGVGRFLPLYIGGGLVASLFQLVWADIIPRSWPARRNYNPYSLSLGASGAVNAVVAWNILTFPTSMMYIYGIIPIPAAIAGLGFLAIDGYGLYSGDTGIGNAAHISGAVVGALTFLATRRGLRRF